MSHNAESVPGVTCDGHSATGWCQAPVLYRITVGSLTRHTCGRHVGWMVGRMLVPGRTAQVTSVTAPVRGTDDNP